MVERRRPASPRFRLAGTLVLLLVLPGCIDLPDDTKGLIEVFIVLLAVNIFLQVVLLTMLFLYFLPFTRPARRRRRR